MAVLTKAKKVVKPSKKIETDDEVETKEETKVVVTKGLATLITQWEEADKKAESYWPRIVQYVAENETSRAELKTALMNLRGMKELTANNEVSKIFKATEHLDLLEQVMDGEMTVREFRDKITKKQEGTDDPEAKFKKAIRRVAVFAISELELEIGDFNQEAKAAYKEMLAKLEAKAQKEAEGSEGSDEDESEDETDTEE